MKCQSSANCKVVNVLKMNMSEMFPLQTLNAYHKVILPLLLCWQTRKSWLFICFVI